MKKYGYKEFEYADDLTKWLNENQHINVINVNHIERTHYYQVFYYIEYEYNISGEHIGMA